VSQSNKTWAGQRRGHYSLRLGPNHHQDHQAEELLTAARTNRKQGTLFPAAGPNHHQDHQAEELLTAARTNRKRINKVLALDDRKLFFCAPSVRRHFGKQRARTSCRISPRQTSGPHLPNGITQREHTNQTA